MDRLIKCGWLLLVVTQSIDQVFVSGLGLPMWSIYPAVALSLILFWIVVSSHSLDICSPGEIEWACCVVLFCLVTLYWHQGPAGAWRNEQQYTLVLETSNFCNGGTKSCWVMKCSPSEPWDFEYSGDDLSVLVLQWALSKVWHSLPPCSV